MTDSVSNPRFPRIYCVGAAVLLLAVTLFVSGCVGNNSHEERRTISVIGSTTVLPVGQAGADAYMDIHRYDEILVSGGGSGGGIKAVGEGTADIGMASRDISANEKQQYPTLVEHIVAVDGIALIVHPSNPVTTLTMDEVKAIYKGEITNWKDLGGNDRSIVPVGRDSASGTREFFYEVVMHKEEFVRTQQELNSNGAVKQTVAQTPDAIGYVGLGYLDTTVATVTINVNGKPVVPTIENIKDASYPIARGLNMYTQGQPSGLVKDYLDFLMSADGQRIVAEQGFVPVK
ncbi:phosphate transport system substrate-binding protein [Methanocalculus alkaliphilus]|uniref:phosphate ABC transporter substrate-binding protein n=1 Tax=Methanocalculus alkaliphilus TaxID=768730 RepID=UPI00209E1A04|nr:phosphate ABC transporter substrate-binding protein [Methanocalculus alkaliphilus]MCP1714528.1 phosphate transport system substrate-binding protein [Methanocalculus alkaliphilus]